MPQDEISLVFALIAGLLSFLSPCVLPLIPAYLSYLLGSSGKDIIENNTKEKWTLFFRAMGFILGFSIVFVILGTTASFLGNILYDYQQIIIRVAGIFIIIFGLHMSGFLKLNFLYKEKRMRFLPKTKGFFPSILVGMAFSLGWTPCIGPILASILVYASTADTVLKGTLLLVFYSIGLGIPFLATALLLDYFSNFYMRFQKYMQYVSKIAGFIFILFGILLFFDKFSNLTLF